MGGSGTIAPCSPLPLPGWMACDQPMTSVLPYPFPNHPLAWVCNPQQEGDHGDPGGGTTFSGSLSPKAHHTLPAPWGAYMLHLEFPLGPLILRFLSQEADGKVAVGDRGGVNWPVMLT